MKLNKLNMLYILTLRNILIVYVINVAASMWNISPCDGKLTCYWLFIVGATWRSRSGETSLVEGVKLLLTAFINIVSVLENAIYKTFDRI